MLGLNQLALTGLRGLAGGISLGPELITNGDFSAGSTGWTINGTGWTISNGVAEASAISNADLVSTLTTAAGKWYEVTFTISEMTGGILRLLAGSASTPSFYENGTYNFKIQVTSGSVVLFFAFAGFTAKLDNVSFKEILGDTSGLVSDY